jgi:hypothetical protein
MKQRPSIASWMASVVVGTYAGAWGFATLSAFMRGGLVKWVVLMAFCSALAAAEVVVLGAIDTILLWLRVRMLPTGRKAWLGSVLSMVLVLGLGMGWPFAKYLGPSGLILSVLAPLIAVPLVVRLILGERCDG